MSAEESMVSELISILEDGTQWEVHYFTGISFHYFTGPKLITGFKFSTDGFSWEL